MSYLALARKYRPQTFDELVGQEFVTTSLKNAIELGRVSHSYLFTGARGVGKTSAARIMAKALNCLNPLGNNPCNVCENCLEITGGTSIDVSEIDGASNRGVDEIRQLREAVKFLPVKCKYKVYIVDEVHMLTDAASNALLKTLEEPPSYVVFIFATTDAHKIMPTILSRCQRFDFRKIPFDNMSVALEDIFTTEKISYDKNALSLIIRQSEGCMRDALSFSDQVIAYSNGNVTYDTVAQMLGISEDPVVGELYSAVLREEASKLDDLISRLSDTGVSLLYATEKMITHTRNLLLLSVGGESIKKELTSEESQYYESLKEAISEPRLFALFQLLQKLHNEIKYSSFARYTFEFGLYKAASLSRVVPLPVNAAQSQAQPSRTISSGSGVHPTVATQIAELAKPVKEAPKKANIQADSSGSEFESLLSADASPEKPAPVSASSEQDTTGVLSGNDQQWAVLLKEFQSIAPPLATILAHGVLTEYGEGKAGIVFPKERVFQYTNASRPEKMALLKEFLEKKSGGKIDLEISIDNGAVGTGEKKKALIDKKNELETIYDKQLKSELAAQPVIKQIMELFDITENDMKVIKDNSTEAKQEEAEEKENGQ